MIRLVRDTLEILDKIEN